MKQVLFFSESLAGGGAETALVQLVKQLDPRSFALTVVTETDNERYTQEIRAYAAHRSFVRSGGRIRALRNKLKIYGSLKLPAALIRRRYVGSTCDIEVAACEGYATKIIAASRDPHSVKIAYVHTDFSVNHWTSQVFRSHEEEAACYARYDYIVCVSETIRDAFVQLFGMEERVVVMHNIIDDARIRRLGEEAPPRTMPPSPVFAMVGSLLKVKGYDRMLEAVRRLRQEGYAFSLLILGSGTEQAALERQIEESGLRSAVELLGYQKNPFAFVSRADCFVCASRAEGYSTAVAEAVILGKPVITTDCSGMREIFGGRNCGIICENSTEGLYSSLKSVLDAPHLLAGFAQEAAARSADFDASRAAAAINTFYKEAKKRDA